MITFLSGDVLDSSSHYIVDQVNNQGVMNRGLAGQIRKKYPGIFEGYRQVCQEYSWEEKKRDGIVYFYQPHPGRVICSVFGQDRYGTDRQYTDYDALSAGLETVARNCRNGINPSVAIPYGLGCGLGGGDWETVLLIIEHALVGTSVRIYQKESFENRKMRKK